MEDHVISLTLAVLVYLLAILASVYAILSFHTECVDINETEQFSIDNVTGNEYPQALRTCYPR